MECAGQRFENLCRKDVFSANPVSIYIPIACDYQVTALSRVEIAVCKVKAEKQYAPFLVRADEVISNQRGQLNWRREVKDIITYKYEGRVDRIVLGETFGYPGQWSSYPSHKHDRDHLPDEVNMEEVYHFRINPKQGFGVQVLYNDDLSLNECYAVRNGDTIAIKEGYHPVAAAPGYQVYYLWVMAGTSGRTLTPNDDPLHAWVKAVEPMVR
ncbi:MAG TPA: 5-deoxy-glucuronate isomerase [Bacillota bacterium]|nr:5-deoxy-glucuronate isomerase [Bacillota bacterium]